jgi:hypothetical protein
MNDFDTSNMIVSAIERPAVIAFIVTCKNEACLTHFRHTDEGICLVCEKVCEGHRTRKTFNFSADVEAEKIDHEINNYACRKCGGKEFITPFGNVSSE